MHAKAKIPESGWQHALRSVLYGRDVDRNVKSKARLGLAIVTFIGIFSIITFRLVMFATVSEGHGGRRSVSQDAVRVCRENGITVIPGGCPNQFLKPDFGHAMMRVMWRAIGNMQVS